MSIETWTASLHAGLIQRARTAPGDAESGGSPPGKVVPLRDREPFGREGAAALRESAISRARSFLSRSPESCDADMPERIPPAVRVPPPARAPETHGYGGWAFGPRFNLTVRVSAAMREMLLDARIRTGRTQQRIMHDALVQYLSKLEREQIVR